MILAAAGQVIDERGDLGEVTRLREMLDSRGLRTEDEKTLAGVHGNGSRGYQQGFLLLERAP